MPNGLASERPIFIGFLRFYHHIHSQGRTPLNSDFALPQRIPMPRLSPLTIERMQPKATRQEVPDSVTIGLYFIVQPSGVKSWAVRYRFDRKPCKLTLGRYPAVELGVARDRAK